MSEQCLELKNVCKSFRDFTLNNISFTLPQGYIMGLVGPNGAGKTTTIQLILNMLEKDAGKILAFGKDNVVSEKEIKQDIGIVFDSIFYVDSWTVKDTEKAVSIFYDNWRHDIFNDMVKRFDLPLNKKVGELSRGMQMKLMLACAFSHDAKLLILDEPTSGLDPLTRDEFLEILQDYIRDGQRSVLFSTHITTDLERVADYITLINRGNMIFTGSMEDLLSSYRLIKGIHFTKFQEVKLQTVTQAMSGFLLSHIKNAVTADFLWKQLILDDGNYNAFLHLIIRLTGLQ